MKGVRGAKGDEIRGNKGGERGERKRIYILRIEEPYGGDSNNYF